VTHSFPDYANVAAKMQMGTIKKSTAPAQRRWDLWGRQSCLHPAFSRIAAD
jgi:hypothetical protein